MQGYQIIKAFWQHIKNSSAYKQNIVFPSESFILLQEDMRLVINQQVQQREEERKREKQQEKDSTVGLQRSKSLKVKGEGGKGFFSSFFKEK